MPVLIQWAEDDGEVQLHSIWKEPINDTLKLIEYFCEAEGVVGFNLVFDWFHLCKIYTIFSLYPDSSAIPEDIIDELANLEPLGRDGPCLKPRSAFDVMLHARKGPYQSTMDRGDVRIRRVPTSLAWQLAAELEKRIPLSDIYFAKRKDKLKEKWQVFDIEDDDGEVIPDFKDIVVKFRPSSGLKVLAVDALKLPPDIVLKFSDVEVDKKHYPKENGYAPFGSDWPEKIRHHILHWSYHNLARKYAKDDVIYTRGLYKHFGSPALGDDDSVLACMIAAVRWRGFKVNLEGLQALKQKTIASKTKIGPDGKPFKIPTAPRASRIYVEMHMDETEKLGASPKMQSNLHDLAISTNKVLLKEIAESWVKDCPNCAQLPEADSDCKICEGKGTTRHPAAIAAEEVLKARQAQYEVDLYDKFLMAGRFHASFNPIGTLSSRMSGGDGLNAQGIKKTKEVRGQFPLAWDDYILCGGDFAGFEVTLAEAEYNDPKLRKQLLTCEGCANEMTWVLEAKKAMDHVPDINNYVQWRLKDEEKSEAKALKQGKSYSKKTKSEIKNELLENDFFCINCGSSKGKKIHALFGVHVYPQHTYESLKATDGTANDLYTKAKSAVFAMMYGGTEHTLMERLGVPLEIAQAALARFHREFPGVKRSQQRIVNMFQSLRQPKGVGTKVEWHEPADKIESMFGFPRYFTLENTICKALFTLANNPPKEWLKLPLRVQRRERIQTAGGAVQSALYGAAFGVQANNTRAAINHVIQSSGATITKETQRKIWDVQPAGVHKFRVIPMNVHDEIMCPTLPEYVDAVAKIVKDTVEAFRPRVPLIKMDWCKKLNTWADKS
jgi:hypothetical protein